MVCGLKMITFKNNKYLKMCSYGSYRPFKTNQPIIIRVQCISFLLLSYDHLIQLFISILSWAFLSRKSVEASVNKMVLLGEFTFIFDVRAYDGRGGRVVKVSAVKS
jgi:hypothetical protein